MELRQLKYFVAAADTLNFSRAAESLYISQPTLSQQISELEKELGVELFIRSKRTVILTPAGAELLTKAKDLLHRAENTMNSVRSAEKPAQVSGRICIGYPDLFISHDLIFRALAKTCQFLRETYPTITIFFRRIDMENVVKALKDGEVDVCICTISIDGEEKELNEMPLCADVFELICSGRMPMEDTRENLVKVLQEKPVFMEEQCSQPMVHFMKIFSELQVMPKIRFMDSLETTKLLVASGDGCILVPKSLHEGFYYDNVHRLTVDVPSNMLYTNLYWDKTNINPIIPVFAKTLHEQIENAEKQP